MSRLGVAVVGAGYWGPNLVRNFQASPGWDLRWVCDLDAERAAARRRRRSTVQVTVRLDDVLADHDVDAVAIATPAGHPHRGRRWPAFEAGKHVLVEKPLAAIAGRRDRSWSTAAEEPGPGPDVRPHLLLHAGRAQDPRARRRRGAGRDPVRRLGPHQPGPGPARRRRASGTWRPTTCRSSTSSCPAELRPDERRRARAPTRWAPARPASAT